MHRTQIAPTGPDRAGQASDSHRTQRLRHFSRYVHEATLSDMNSESAQLISATRHFSALLSSTPRGARLARLLAAEWLRMWDLPRGVAEAAEHVLAELVANATTHGRLPGRSARVVLRADTDVLRIAVTDTRGDTLPELAHQPSCPLADSGRGLLIVEALADRWGVERGPVPQKTVWAECALAPASTHARSSHPPR